MIAGCWWCRIFVYPSWPSNIEAVCRRSTEQQLVTRMSWNYSEMPNTCHNEYVLELYMNLKVLVLIEYYFWNNKGQIWSMSCLYSVYTCIIIETLSTVTFPEHPRLPDPLIPLWQLTQADVSWHNGKGNGKRKIFIILLIKLIDSVPHLLFIFTFSACTLTFAIYLLCFLHTLSTFILYFQ